MPDGGGRDMERGFVEVELGVLGRGLRQGIVGGQECRVNCGYVVIVGLYQLGRYIRYFKVSCLKSAPTLLDY